jgi:hypothetical protein
MIQNEGKVELGRMRDRHMLEQSVDDQRILELRLDKDTPSGRLIWQKEVDINVQRQQLRNDEERLFEENLMKRVDAVKRREMEHG